MECFTDLMGGNMKDNGKMENKKVWDFLHRVRILEEKEFGKEGKE